MLSGFLDEEKYGKAEFWGYYASCDFVVLYQLFGTLIDFPYKQYISDIKQLADFLGDVQLPPNKDKHHALKDARWIKNSYQFLQKILVDRK